jgi:hypothetical protein
MTSRPAEDAADLSPSAGGPGGPGGPSWLRLFLGRRWKAVLVAALASAALAWVAGLQFGQDFWRSEGILVYTTLPVRDLDKGLYVPPSAQTMLALIKSPGNLESLRKEFGLALPLRVLEERIKVTQPHNTEMIQITLDWPDPKDGAAMVNRLMALHTLQAAAMRKDAVAATLLTVAQAHHECDDKFKAAQEKYDTFVAATKFNGIKLEAERTEKEIATLEMGLMLARHDCDSCRARQRKVGAAKAGAGGPGAAPEGDAVASGFEASYAPLKSQLSELLEAEQEKLTEAGKKFVAKRKEYAQMLSLIRDRAASRAEVEKVFDEMNLLTLQRENSSKAIERYRQEIDALPAQYAAGQEAAVKGDLEEAQKTMAQLQGAVETKYRRAAELAPLLHQEEALARAVKECRDDRRLLDGQLEGLRQLRDAAPTEFTVAAPAAPAA